MKRIFFFLCLLVVLTIPSFWRMARSGMYTVQDPVHYFRLVEYDKCVKNFQIPCRWALDAGLGYGEPVFNFYGQLSYAIGEVFHLTGLSFIDSLKLLFILSLAGSGVAMFFLSRYLWKNNLSALISGVIYVYAPYRAVDVWVRGALPEALSFVIFPLIILSIEKKRFFSFSFLLFLLIINHNLSVLLFSPVLIVWIIYRRYWKGVLAGVVSLAMSAFYLLPLAYESKYINLLSTTQGYFDFRGHFASAYQLFVSRFWGYGASLFKETEMSRSIGLVQWVLPLTVLVFLVIKKELKKQKDFLVLIALGVFALFLTHNQSTFLWIAIDPMKYIQFPWRFLGTAVFCLSLASGAAIFLIKENLKIYASIIVVLAAILLNFSFFKEDIWMNVSDSDMQTGSLWDTQIRASIGDFWPNLGHKIPTAPSNGEFINYFPGWNHSPDENGLISAKGAVFSNTPIRTIGNIISLIVLCGTIIFIFI